jgi:hypothetical protein
MQSAELFFSEKISQMKPGQNMKNSRQGGQIFIQYLTKNGQALLINSLSPHLVDCKK